MEAQMIFYPHYCYDCQMQYFGVEQNAKRTCVRCGSTNVINGPQQMHKTDQNAIGAVAGGK